MTAGKHCYSNEYETFVATSLEEAFGLYLEWGAREIDDDHKIEEWDEIPDDYYPLNLFFEDRDIGQEWQAVIPPEAKIARKEEHSTVYSAAAGQWAAINKIGFLCTTEY